MLQAELQGKEQHTPLLLAFVWHASHASLFIAKAFAVCWSTPLSGTFAYCSVSRLRELKNLRMKSLAPYCPLNYQLHCLVLEDYPLRGNGVLAEYLSIHRGTSFVSVDEAGLSKWWKRDFGRQLCTPFRCDDMNLPAGWVRTRCVLPMWGSSCLSVPCFVEWNDRAEMHKQKNTKKNKHGTSITWQFFVTFSG